MRAGEWDSTVFNQLHSAQERRVHHVVIHEEYYAGALYNDIALLFLQAKLRLAPNIGLVCLPREGEVLDSSQCVASGWGTDTAGECVLCLKYSLKLVFNYNKISA